jgi:hypothetical protein
MKKQERKIRKKAVGIFQIVMLLVSTFAFIYLVSFSVISGAPGVKADSIIPTSCCKQTKDGATCQTINSVDSDICKTAPITTSCDYTDGCQLGCCYSSQEGICSLNAPKDKCISSGGNWTNSPVCNIPQCQLGCCIFGEQASVTTSRECTKLSQQLNLNPNFKSLDAFGSCNVYTGLSEKGACVTSTGDFSGENNCKFTTKGMCKTGEFYSGYLCTAKELNTVCKPSKKTTCLDGKDEVYFTDTCNNPANVYDANKFSNQSYWEKIISTYQSCSGADKDCGNCDYLSGSVCNAYRSGKDTKPTYGDNVCRDLNCANGKKHGESWCISDYNSEIPGVSPVGSRFFRGVCMDGEISIQPCADFNNEICISGSYNGFSEAKCTVNDWRSCIQANEKESYDEVKRECEQYDQCVMFNEISGVEDISEIPGFKEIENSEQGAAGDIGKGSNAVIPYCVPKYTPGMVFWATPNPFSKNASSTTRTTSTSSTNSGSTNSASSGGKIPSLGNNYGGSLAETQAICSLGSFTCVSHMKRHCETSKTYNPLDAGLCFSSVGVSALIQSPTCDDWTDEENWECNFDASNPNAKEQVQTTVEALNERCHMLGSCGVNVNIVGELGSTSLNSSIKRMLISAEGDNINISREGYELSQEYLDSIKNKPGIIPAGNLKTLTQAITLALITGKITEKTGADQAGSQAQETLQKYQQISAVSGSLGSLGAMGLGKFMGESIAVGTVLQTGTYTSGAITFTTQTGTQITQTLGEGTIATLTKEGSFTGVTIISGGKEVGYAATEVISGMPKGIGLNGYTTPASTGISSLAVAGYEIVGAAIGMAMGYLVGQLIVKNQHWSPGRGEQFMKGIMSLGGSMGAAVVLTYFIIAQDLCAAGPLGCIIGIILIVLGSIYTNCIDNAYTEHQYYTLQYTCQPWQPPKTGNCDSCNDDVRTCSEYRCRSLGQNCHYFMDNGEPGYCATVNDIWSATIKPWPEALSTEHKYTNVKETSFKIESKNTEKVDGWTPITFGIITDKYAKCKIDNKHTKSFDEMAIEMILDVPAYSAQEAQDASQGSYHKVVLSPSLMPNQTGQGTLAFSPGENNYYIRCKNFAGSSNAAEFAVKVISDSGLDLTPPIVKSFNPSTNSYLKVGANSSSLTLWVSEPSDCKYSQGYDLKYSDMNDSLICLTDSSSVLLGNWPCYTTLKNLTSGENKFFFKCRDNPNQGNETAKRQNTNENAKLYSLNVCKTGLNITSLSPENEIIVGKSPISMEIKATTSGCVNNGQAVCSYKFNNASAGLSSQYIDFLKTNSNTHSQIFTSLPSGNQSISVRCQDSAGNSDEKILKVQVTLDNDAPIILRNYDINQKLTIITNEKSQCGFVQNSSIGCSFTLADKNIALMDGSEKTHTTQWSANRDYYIKCIDGFGNEEGSCIKIRTY